jgi:hypothetical protein
MGVSRVPPRTARGRVRAAARGLALAAALLAAPAAARRVVIVGVDGGSWNAIDPLLAAGELPNLAALAAGGVHADLDTVEPVISPVVWTSIATGVGPARHGIAHFLATRLDLALPTIFERLAARGHRVGLYDWLAMWPPPVLPGGFVVPGWLRRDATITPADLWTRAGLAPWTNSYEALRTQEAYLENARSEIVEKPPRFRRLVERFDCDVAAVVFYGVDAVSHRFWRASYPGDFAGAAGAPPPDGSRPVQEILRGTDRAIGEIRAWLAPDDVLLVVSDHGFQANPEGAVVWESRLDGVLASEGLVADRDAFSILGEFAGVVVRVHPGPFGEREALLERLRALVASARDDAGGAVFRVEVVDAAPRPPGAQRGLLARLRQAGVRLLLRWRFGVTLDAPAHAWLVAAPRAERLGALWPDGAIAVGAQQVRAVELFSRHDFSGTHLPTGVMVAAGGPLVHRPERDRVSVLDVAPLIAWLAGEAIPDDLDGELPRRWIDPAALEREPPRVAPAPAVPLAEARAGASALGDAELTERLRRLGYVE